MIRLRGRRTNPSWRPRVLDDEYRDQVTQRVEAASALVRGDERTRARIAAAPPGYLLAHSSADIVRHCELLEPLAAPGDVRVVATPGRAAGVWRLDVATRDRPGLLAAFTGVLLDGELDVVQAVVATWDDGGALQAFVVRSPDAPRPAELEPVFADALVRPRAFAAIPDAHVVFDDDASPLYTACHVVAPDAPGLLHAIAGAVAAAGVDIHAARVATVDGMARDRFDLSDRDGHKLDEAQEVLIRDELCGRAVRRA
jgi:[protein-PII] uridylyltransferase